MYNKTLALVALLFVSSLAAQPSRNELLKAPKYVESKPAKFQTFTPEALSDALKVSSRRNYAVMGFNDGAVTVRLPAATNSVYANVEFEQPVIKDAKGKPVTYEMETGIFDPDMSSTEVRMPKAEYARASGKVTVRYPLVVKTVSMKKGAASKDLKIDGPYVSYNTGKVQLPEAAFGSEVHPLRAYDASGKELERSDDGSTSLVGMESWRKVPFYGNVAEVRRDSVEKWCVVVIDYDLPAAPKWTATQQGLVPSMDARMKSMETPGGRVTKQVKKD